MFSNNTPTHKNNDICPCCSVERDRGGRLLLEVKRNKNSRGHILFWLKCPICKYSVASNCTKENGMVKFNERFEYINKLKQARKAKQSLVSQSSSHP